MSRKLEKALKQQKLKTQQVPQDVYGTLITINGFVEVKDRPSFVYVQLRDNQNELIQAFNNKVAASEGLPVIVRREGNRYIIQGVNSQRYQNTWNNYAPYLPKHGSSHSFIDGGGGDVSWMFSRQFMPNLVYPNDGGMTGTSVYIAPHVLLLNNSSWAYTGATGTPNLTIYKGTGSSSSMVLVYLDANTGNPGLLVGSGSYFPNTLTGTATIYPYIPIPDTVSQIPLAAVRMDTGTQSITWNNIYDVRQWVHARPSGTSSGGGGGGVDTIGFVGQNKGIYLATGTVLNVNGSRLTLSVSGTVFNLTNSPDPQELIGIYGLSSGTPLGTGTSIDFKYPLSAFITGTSLFVESNTIPYDGWIPVSVTWTRTGNHTFTVAGDVTATYRKGTKIRYRDGGSDEYGVIQSSSHAAGTTTVTLITTTDYAMAAATITNKFISYMENPEGFPQWFGWETTFVNIGVSNGTLTCKWRATPKQIFFEIDFILGNSSSVSGDVSFSPPAPIAETQSSGARPPIGLATFLDAATALFYGAVNMISSSSLTVKVYNAAGTYTSQSNLSSTVPMTWTTNDCINIQGWHQY